MEPKPAIRDELLAHAPGLRRFALSLCGTIDRAEDLVQDTFLQALTHLDSFQPGTNLAPDDIDDVTAYYAGVNAPEMHALAVNYATRGDNR
jgi:hypothetical protein